MKRRPYRFMMTPAKTTRPPKLKMIRIQGILTPFQRCNYHCVHCGLAYIYKQATDRLPIYLCLACGKTAYIQYDQTKDTTPTKEKVM